MRKYHHLGIPTLSVKPGERYLEKFKVFVSGYEESEFGIEWMRFEKESPLPEIVKTVPHVAFETDDIEAELKGREVIITPNSPSEGVTAVFVVENGAPVEFIQFEDPGVK